MSFVNDVYGGNNGEVASVEESLQEEIDTGIIEPAGQIRDKENSFFLAKNSW